MLKHLRLTPLLAVLALVGCGTTHHATTQKVTPGPAACPGYQTQYGCQAHSPTFGLPPQGLTLTPRSAVPTVAMYDSISVSVIPHGSVAVAGYLSGNWPTWFSLRAAFPAAVRIPVAVRALPVYPSLVGRMACLDVEPLDATPAEAGPWARGEIGLGVKPCLYSALKNGMAQTEQSLAHWLGAGWRAKVFLWDADWTGSPRLDGGFDATQWSDHGPRGENYDQSVATRAFLGLKPPAPPLPVCIHKRMSKSACSAAKKRIASDQRAAASSQRAYTARGCSVLAQRDRWFAAQLAKHPKVKNASRKRALAASRTAYRQRSCAAFSARAVFFDAAAATLTAAN
jgi:hypothetical protein